MVTGFVGLSLFVWYLWLTPPTGGRDQNLLWAACTICSTQPCASTELPGGWVRRGLFSCHTGREGHPSVARLYRCERIAVWLHRRCARASRLASWSRRGGHPHLLDDCSQQRHIYWSLKADTWSVAIPCFCFGCEESSSCKLRQCWELRLFTEWYYFLFEDESQAVHMLTLSLGRSRCKGAGSCFLFEPSRPNRFNSQWPSGIGCFDAFPSKAVVHRGDHPCRDVYINVVDIPCNVQNFEFELRCDASDLPIHRAYVWFGPVKRSSYLEA